MEMGVHSDICSWGRFHQTLRPIFLRDQKEKLFLRTNLANGAQIWQLASNVEWRFFCRKLSADEFLLGEKSLVKSTPGADFYFQKMVKQNGIYRKNCDEHANSEGQNRRIGVDLFLSLQLILMPSFKIFCFRFNYLTKSRSQIHVFHISFKPFQN